MPVLIRSAVALVLLVVSASSVDFASRLLQDVPPQNFDYTNAGKFAVRRYDESTGIRYSFCRLLGTGYQVDQDNNLMDYFLDILVENPDGTTSVYSATVVVNNDSTVPMILKNFNLTTVTPVHPCLLAF